MGKTEYSCESCGLFKDCKSPQRSEYGLGHKKILILDGSVSKKQDDLGESFVSELHQYLAKVLKDVNIDLYNDCWYLNSIQCFPGKKLVKGKPPTIAINSCRVRVLKKIKELKPRNIIVLGETPMKVLYGHRCNGRISIAGHQKFVGCEIPDQELGCFVYPTFSPYYILSSLYERRKQLMSWGKYKYSKEPIWQDKQIDRKDDHFVRQLWFYKTFHQVSKVKPFKRYNYEDEIEIIYDVDKAIEALKYFQKQSITTFDYETNSLKPHAEGHKILCVSIADSKRSVCFPISYSNPEYLAKYNSSVFSDNPEFMKELKRYLINPRVKKVGMNAPFEEIWTREILGYKVNGWCDDVMLMAHCLDNRTGVTGLKYQTFTQLGIVGYDDEADKYMKADDDKNCNDFNHLEEMDLKDLLTYCNFDSLYAFKLYEKYKPLFDKDPFMNNGYKLFVEGELALVDVSQNGFLVDEEYLIGNMQKLDVEITKLNMQINNCDEVKKWDGEQEFSYASNDHMKHLLYEILKYPITKRTEKNAPSVDADTLSKIEGSELCKLIGEVRKLEKIKNTFLAGIVREIVNGVVHSNFLLNSVTTYRSSSTSPNMTNISKHNETAKKYIRGCFKAPPGWRIVEIDYSGLETRVAAAVSGDSNLTRYNDDPNSDMHLDSAVSYLEKNRKEIDVDKERYLVKNKGVFPSFYGAGYKKIAHGLWENMPYETKEHLKKRGYDTYEKYEVKAKEAWDEFWNVRFPEYRNWRERQWRIYTRTGELKLNTGFYYHSIGIRNEALNAPVQGPGFHMLLWSLIQLNNWLKDNKMESKIIGEIHDSIVLLVKNEELDTILPVANKIMTQDVKEKWAWINVLLKVEADIYADGGRWDEKEKSIEL